MSYHTLDELNNLLQEAPRGTNEQHEPDRYEKLVEDDEPVAKADRESTSSIPSHHEKGIRTAETMDG